VAAVSAASREAAALRGVDRVGRDVRIEGVPHVENLGRIEIGDGVLLRSVPVVSHLVTGPGGVLRIGREAVIGHGAAVAAHARIEVGERARIGPYAMIMDTDFHEAGDHAAASEPRPIHIGADARIGARVTILRGAVVGAGAVVAAGSVVSGVVAPDARVAGVPARMVAAADASAGGDVAERTRRVLMHTFGLPAEPPGRLAPGDVTAWDSLGTLNLLLTLEDTFAITIDEQEMLAVRSVADLERLVAAKLGGRQGARR
jgi:maltose O-acetyltransferase